MGLDSMTPGPGNYQIDSAAFGKNHKFHMGIKLNDHEKFNTPGAGSYNPDMNTVNKAMPKSSMKSRLNKSSMEDSPGPAHYDSHLKNKRDAPRYGFGSSGRAGMNKNDSPGPGHYKINVKVAETAGYAIPGKQETFKYV